MNILQVKYCYSENELNNFLQTLNIDNNGFPKLQSIQYCAKVSGDGVETEKADENGVTAQAKVNSDVIAIVQYFINYDEAANKKQSKTILLEAGK